MPISHDLDKNPLFARIETSSHKRSFTGRITPGIPLEVVHRDLPVTHPLAHCLPDGDYGRGRNRILGTKK